MKNLDFLLKALHKTKKIIRLSVYGPIDDDSYWRRCRKLIETMPVNITLRYKGVAPPDKVHSIFSAHDVFILPSRGESYGHVIMESLIAGTPVIISDKTPWQEDVDKAITVLPLTSENMWINEIEKWVDGKQNILSKRSFAAKRFAKLCLLNKKIVIQNKNFFFSFIN